MLDFFTSANVDHFDNWRLQGVPGRVVCFLANEVECAAEGCGFDEFSQSAKKLGCVECGGNGKLTRFAQAGLRARVVWIGERFFYGGAAPGVELGDVSLGVTENEITLVRRVLDSPNSYLVVDKETVRPLSIQPMVIPGIEEAYLVGCSKYTSGNAGES